MNNEKLNDNQNVILLTDLEVEQISGGLAPLVIWGLWAGGGALTGLAAAAIVHYFGKGSHAH